MVSLLRGRFRGDRDPGGIVRHTVGNAVVLHAEGVISPEAQSLALSVAEDHENDVVVLDLADGMPITSWESMAGALPRRRRGIRLMTCGRQHGPAAMAGQWLSERLNRTVVAVPAVPASPAVGVLPPAPTIGTAAAVVGAVAEVLAAEVVAAIEPVTAVEPEPTAAVPIAALPEPIALAVGLAPVSPGPASAPPPPTPRPHDTASDATGTAPTPRPPAPAPAPVRRQPVPAPAAAALLVEGRPLTDERAWLRRTLSREFDQLASSVARLLSEHPGMQRSAGHAVDEVLADWVAVRLYLSRRGAAIDAGLRSGEPGPHVPFARCAVAGLSRLPSHRGATVYTTTASDAQWALYRRGGLVTEWGFVNALTAPCAGQDGDVDVLLWSMTARRTALLEPGGEERADDRVLFVPGTSFKILEVRRPEGGRRGHVM
ncbi:hypothetical protein QLR68_20790, partial [Micromonospora sp. DH15]|nr:hypothetical protein [Micromonospora sp. DH15]